MTANQALRVREELFDHLGRLTSRLIPLSRHDFALEVLSGGIPVTLHSEKDLEHLKARFRASGWN